MKVARQNHAVALVAGNAIVIGGCGTAVGCQTGGATYLSSVEQYTAGGNDSWAFIASMKSSRAFHTATTLPPTSLHLNGQILVTGGIGSDSGSTTTGTLLKSAELYDPATNTWTPTGSMTSARAGHTATLLTNGTVLIVGGITNLVGGTISPTAEIFDPAGGGTFKLTTDLSFSFFSPAPFSARAYHTALSLNSGAVLLAGGLGPLKTIETFDLINGFLSVGNMSTARAFHTVTPAGALGNDVALFIGGDAGTGALTSAETWNYVPPSTATMGTGRESHTATKLPSGKVLVAGGLSGGMPQLSSEVWDPSTLGFTTTRGSMTDARAFHTAIYIPSISRVLVAGGEGGTAGAPVTLSSAELYHPTQR
jgi:hypothetical protein